MIKRLIIIYLVSFSVWSADFVDYKQCRNVESSVGCDRSCKLIGKIKFTIDAQSERVIKTIQFNDGTSKDQIESECDVVESNRFECRHADANSFRYEYYDGERYRSGNETMLNPSENTFFCAVIKDEGVASGWLNKLGF